MFLHFLEPHALHKPLASETFPNCHKHGTVPRSASVPEGPVTNCPSPP